MRIIIAGSRTIDDNYLIVRKAVRLSGFDVTEVVSGCARGVDHLGEVWASKNVLPVKQFPADWDKNGKSAGYKRNMEMAHYADGLIAIWNGYSKGTGHMIGYMKQLGKPVHVLKVLCN